ncbi:MAG: hypothetical protein GC162_11395 [Planctomycetes bacterium]|nr:hypothetical protein [Planctomycetota bacterium]
MTCHARLSRRGQAAYERQGTEADIAFGDGDDRAAGEFVGGLIRDAQDVRGGLVAVEFRDSDADHGRMRSAALVKKTMEIAVVGHDHGGSLDRFDHDPLIIRASHPQRTNMLGFVTGVDEQLNDRAGNTLIEKESHEAGLNSMMRSSSVAAA